MSYSGTNRDLKRRIDGEKIQDEMRDTFKRKINELKKKTDIEINKMKLDNMFSTQKSTYEEVFRKSLIGLQTQKEFLSKKEVLSLQKDVKKLNKKKKLEKEKKKHNLLTFVIKDNEQNNLDTFICDSKKCKKNPAIDTSFLPDITRDKADEKLKEKIREEFIDLQDSLKKSIIEITFSYWDGSNHRRTMRIERGTLIVEFLELACKELEKNFVSLRGLHGNNLMFIKGDLIIGHSYNFQDIILVKAYGFNKQKLFQLEEWEDTEKNEIYFKDNGVQGKIVTHVWYERNKHIYPGNKWVLYDPSLHSNVKF